MKTGPLLSAAISLLLFACAPSPAPSASVPVSAHTAVVTAPSASANAPGTQISLQVIVPEESARAGVEGNGWTVDLIAKGNSGALDRIKPTFRMSTTSGKNSAFPGLVVVIRPVGASSTIANASGSPLPSALPNLAGFFQIVGLPNTNGGAAGISSIDASASSSPAASASAAARATTSVDTAEATWFVLQSLWGTNVDVELTALVVDGDAPETLTDVGELKAVSNVVTVRYHINGSGVAPSSTVRPTPSASPTP